MDASFTFSRHFPSRFAVCGLLICALCWLAGCSSIRGKGGTAQASSKPLFTSPFDKKKTREIVDPEAGMDEYDASMVKFEKQEYDVAAKEFKALAKQYYDYPVEEDALFMVAECRFAEQRYGWAQDGYDGLIKKFPSTRYLEKSTRRLYTIAAIWLNGDGTTKTDELIQVSATDVTKPDVAQHKPVPNSTPLVPNLFDKSRPLFDTPGNALKALKSVWLHDPLGPLADDALMMLAVYHIRKGHLRDADQYLDTLRKEYPKSEHTQTAFVVGSHIKLASYQGARYDGRDLVDADDLIHSTLNLFPDLPDRDELKLELVKIRDQGAERYWSRAEYYQGRDKPQSEAIYLELILKEFPDSSVAKKAAQRLKELGPKHWTGMLDQYPDEKQIDPPRTPKAAPSARPVTPKRPTREPAAPAKPGRQSQPPAKIGPDFEELPDAQPREPADSYEQLPPARQKVDAPDLVDEENDRGIEQTKFSRSAGRATP